MKPTPTNKKLYEKVKEEAKKKFKVWPSAYASGWLVKEYKRRSGKYSGRKTSSSGISRWYKEKWINVCKLPKKVSCGRSKLSKTWKKNYPYCRPSIRVNKSTARISSEISMKEIKKRCSRKRKSPMKRMKNDGGNSLIEEINKSTDIEQVYEYMITSVINENNYPKLLKLMLDPDLKKLVETDKRLVMLDILIKNLNLADDDKKITELKKFIKFLKFKKGGGNSLIEKINKSTDIEQVYEYMITFVENEKDYPELLKLMLDPELKKVVESDKRLNMLDILIQILNLVDDKKITELTEFIQFLNKLKEQEPPSKKRKLDK